jgi:methylthioribulose-1-phosphate dehydratase
MAATNPDPDALRAVGRRFYQRGWSLGTSSNYSVVLRRQPLELLVTASGKNKGRLGREDFVVVDGDGHPTAPGQPKSSAETLLHTTLARRTDAGAVLHTHSVWGTLLSDLYFEPRGFTLEGYEMLKGLAGVTTHGQSVWLEIFDNTQDIPSLARAVEERLNDPQRPLRHGFLIRNHGLYTWGRSLEEAERHIEVLEFLFECLGRRLMITGETSLKEESYGSHSHRN